MKIYIAGISCIGKTTIGKKLAELLQLPFYDLDHEIEVFFGKPIEKIQDEFLTISSFRTQTSKALENLLNQKKNETCIIALPPSGLTQAYFRFIKKTDNLIIVLKEKPEIILDRIVFYDRDSNILNKQLNEAEKKYFLKEIKADISYHNRTYAKADLTIDLCGLNIEKSAKKIKNVIHLQT